MWFLRLCQWRTTDLHQASIYNRRETRTLLTALSKSRLRKTHIPFLWAERRLGLHAELKEGGWGGAHLTVLRPAVPPCCHPALPGVPHRLPTSGAKPRGDGGGEGGGGGGREGGRGVPPWLNMVRGYATHP